jgi:hypothetical protein
MDGKWTFPAVTMEPGEFLVVFATGLDRRPTDGSNLHTNFRLSDNGEYLALFDNSGAVRGENLFFPDYPEQPGGLVYGTFPGETGFFYLNTPTPGAQNQGGRYRGLVEPAQSSVEHGFYDEPFSLTLSTPTPDAYIRYTTDGSLPNPISGTLYTEPVNISQTSILRVGAFRTGWRDADATTFTYVFIDDILTQYANGQPPAGWPRSGQINGQTMDYGMDPDIVNDPRYSSLMVDALLDLPSISIVTELRNLVDPQTGMYVNALGDGREWERPASAELFYPDGTPGFTINAGLRMRGGYSRNDHNPKHAFRLFFREEYGPTKLKYPMFGDEGTDEFDNIDLRTSQNYAWSLYGDPLNTMNRDVFSRDTSRDMNQPYTRSRYYHLYLNGQYWGLFQSEERPEASFGETYFGGDKDDYDAIKADRDGFQNVATDGSLDAYAELWALAVAGFESDAAYYRVLGLNPDGSRNPEYPIWVDLDNVIDYMLIIYYTGNFDAPVTQWYRDEQVNNYNAILNRVDPQGWQFIQHDSEHTLLDVNENRTGPYAGGQLPYFNPQWLNQQLLANSKYRMYFADRVYKHFFNDGVFTPEQATARFLARADEIRLAIVAESARWGDFYWNRTNSPLNRDDHWQVAIDNIVNNYFPRRTGIVLEQFIEDGWYPTVEAPEFNQRGGYVDAGFELSLSSGSGTIYYTLDGTDPGVPLEIIAGVENTVISESAAKVVRVPVGPEDLHSPQGAFSVGLYRTTQDLSTLDAALEMLADPGDQPALTRTTANVINYLNTGETGHFDSDTSFPGMTIDDDSDHFVMQATAAVLIPAAGAWSFGVNSDDGFLLRIGNGATVFESSFGDLRGAEDTIAVFQFDKAGVYPLELIAFENLGGASVEFFAAQGTHNTFGAEFDLVGDTANGGLALVTHWTSPGFAATGWQSGTDGVGYEGDTGYEAFIGTDVSEMVATNASCLIRIPFTLTQENLDNTNSLFMNIRYDDGFVAYLNGVQVAQANAPTGVVWNDISTAGHNDPLAMAFEQVSLEGGTRMLRVGENVLAIHGLNSGVNSSDFLCSVELIASESQGVSGEISPTAVEYTGPITLNGTTHIRSRVFDDGVWSPLNEATFAVGALADDLRVTEIMFHPPEAPESHMDAEFIELTNVGEQTINLARVRLTKGVDFNFPDMDLLPGGRILVVKDQAVFESIYGTDLPVAGVYEGSLSNSGERIRLRDALNAIIQEFSYDDDWYPDADGGGASLNLLDPANPNLAAWGTAAAWEASIDVLGTPGS